MNEEQRDSLLMALQIGQAQILERVEGLKDWASKAETRQQREDEALDKRFRDFERERDLRLADAEARMHARMDEGRKWLNDKVEKCATKDEFSFVSRIVWIVVMAVVSGLVGSVFLLIRYLPTLNQIGRGPLG